MNKYEQMKSFCKNHKKVRFYLLMILLLNCFKPNHHWKIIKDSLRLGRAFLFFWYLFVDMVIINLRHYGFEKPLATFHSFEIQREILNWKVETFSWKPKIKVVVIILLHTPYQIFCNYWTRKINGPANTINILSALIFLAKVGILALDFHYTLYIG